MVNIKKLKKELWFWYMVSAKKNKVSFGDGWWYFQTTLPYCLLCVMQRRNVSIEPFCTLNDAVRLSQQRVILYAVCSIFIFREYRRLCTPKITFKYKYIMVFDVTNSLFWAHQTKNAKFNILFYSVDKSFIFMDYSVISKTMVVRLLSWIMMATTTTVDKIDRIKFYK